MKENYTWQEYAASQAIDVADVGTIVLERCDANLGGDLSWADSDFCHGIVGISEGDNMATVKKRLGHGLDVVRGDVQNASLLAGVDSTVDFDPLVTGFRREDAARVFVRLLVWLSVT